MNALEREVEGLPFLDKLITVYEKGRCDYWESRHHPPNLSQDEFELVLYRIDKVISLIKVI